MASIYVSLERVAWLVTLLALLALVGYPLAMLVYGSLVIDGKLTLAVFYRIMRDPHLVEYTWNTLVLSAAVTLVSTAIGVPLAWLVVRSDMPYRGLVRLLAVLPFVFPPYIMAMGWISLADPTIGLVNRVYRALGGSGYLVDIYGFHGLVLVMSFRFYVYVFLSTAAALEQMDPSLEEAARVSGASMLRVLRDVTLPLVAPSIASGALLAFVATAENFGIPALIGEPAGYRVLTTRIYSAIDMFDLEGAAAYSMILLALAVPLLVLQRHIARRRRYTTVTGRAVRPRLVGLGWARLPLLAVVLVLLVPSVVAPIVTLVLTAFLKTSYASVLDPRSYTLEHIYEVLFVNTDTQTAIMDSLVLAVTSATTVSLFGLLVAYLVARSRVPGRGLLDWLSSAPFTLPGSVFALAMILAFIGTPLYNTLALLYIAYVARYLSYGVRTCMGALLQIDPSLEEAARVSGAGWLRTLRDIVIPLVKHGVVASWILVFMPTLSELTVSVILAPPGQPTIGKAVYDLMEEGQYEWAYAMSLIVVAIVLAGQILVNLATRRVGVKPL